MTTELRAAASQVLLSMRGYRQKLGSLQPCDAERDLFAALSKSGPRSRHGEVRKMLELCAACRRGLDENSAIEDEDRAYEEGWRAAASWAKRKDLVAEIGSLDYAAERATALGRSGLGLAGDADSACGGITHRRSAAQAELEEAAAEAAQAMERRNVSQGKGRTIYLAAAARKLARALGRVRGAEPSAGR
jgi:hypothetical protein